jgi:hypothetical protein
VAELSDDAAVSEDSERNPPSRPRRSAVDSVDGSSIASARSMIRYGGPAPGPCGTSPPICVGLLLAWSPLAGWRGTARVTVAKMGGAVPPPSMVTGRMRSREAETVPGPAPAAAAAAAAAAAMSETEHSKAPSSASRGFVDRLRFVSSITRRSNGCGSSVRRWRRRMRANCGEISRSLVSVLSASVQDVFTGKRFQVNIIPEDLLPMLFSSAFFDFP